MVVVVLAVAFLASGFDLWLFCFSPRVLIVVVVLLVVGCFLALASQAVLLLKCWLFLAPGFDGR